MNPALALSAAFVAIPPGPSEDVMFAIGAIAVAIIAIFAIRDNRKRMANIRRKYCNTKTLDKS
jgi:hypothetical protein